ncbi:YfdX family protein [Variovorax rhizosphaerae]|uniref:YfdX family protein n=1 Tax=Variovorax rhizosphaerae TaxID=1836200 RepID=A0ABU8WE62_9BURK
MNARNFHLAPVAVATVVGFTMFGQAALAQAPQAKPAEMTKSAEMAKAPTAEQALMKVSQDGYMAVRAARGARMDIFNGNIKGATDLLARANASLTAAKKDAPMFIVEVKTGMDGKVVKDTTSVDRANLVPIDGQIVLADNYIDTPAKRAHIDKANEHFSKGRAKEGRDELRLAEVDAAFTRVLMPIDATAKNVAEATRLLGEKKYYEANLALKAVEDGLRIDTVALSEPVKAASPKG